MNVQDTLYQTNDDEDDDNDDDVLKKRLHSLHRRAVKLIFPDTTVTTDQKLKEMRIMSL